MVKMSTNYVREFPSKYNLENSYVLFGEKVKENIFKKVKIKMILYLFLVQNK